ncbi:MAG: sulfotransferase [Proteobacteria bacterium]|nr:sulfotransferase [Pseudomonadota bacterium]
MVSASTPVSQADPAVLQGISQAVGSGNLRAAFELAHQAILRGQQHPVLFNARALWLQQTGRLQDAADNFQQARAFTPNDPNLLNALGLCLARLNRTQDAIALFEEAIALNPKSAQSHFHLGWARGMGGDQKGARKSYERAVTLDPRYPEALSGIAAIAAREGDRDGARSFAQKALRLNPREPTAIVALAMADIAEGAFQTAEERLQPLLGDPGITGHTRALMLGFYADAMNGLGRTGEAFAAYKAKNEELYRINAPRFAERRRATDIFNTVASQLEQLPDGQAPVLENPGASGDGPREHVFLLGFIRSGTTLLEQVLGSNAGVAVLEERETLADIAPPFLLEAGGLDRLSTLPGDELSKMRARYWERVREFGGEPNGKVFIDKQPLNTFNLPVIAKLFPGAKILFALRDPRDVVFSSFRRHFEVNATMFEFLRLQDAARFYDAVMRVGMASLQKFPLAVHRHRYEDMVADFEPQVRAVCDFLGIAWDDSMRNFSESAKMREIRSPSVLQVRRELYREGVDQWKKYERQLADILPILAPWVEKFGYPRG